MMNMASEYVGVDVSKHHLDLAHASLPGGWRVSNSETGVAALLARLRDMERPHLICEATGSYTRPLVQAAARQGIAVSRVNPRRIRDFARACGQLAKTDKIDAAIMVRFAQAMHPPVSPPADAATLQLADYVRRRRQLIEMLVMEKQRLEPSQADPLRSGLDAHLAFLKAQIADIDRRIAERITTDAQLARRRQLLETIPGIGLTTAAVLIAELPELGRIGKKQIAALAGVAPINHDSGLSRGQAHIAGGRLSVRCALYMATLAAIRANPPVRAFYKHLRQQGKPGKLALTAAMRKMLIIANAIIANNRPWIPDQP